MLDPVELQLSPSCYNCLSWSADGELAIAAGEYVQVLTPKRPAESGQNDTKTRDWHITRFRANVFTNREWPTIYPQNRDDFSIGPEQSLSTVVGLAWSPPGLAKYRRCILAVLTSNLLVSFFEPVGPGGKWVRVAVVNQGLRSHFDAFIHDEGLIFRKSNIRSFTWCPPLKILPTENVVKSHSVPGIETRWGVHLLSVANDDNDVILLHVRRSEAESNASHPYLFDMLSLASMHDPEGTYSISQAGSVLAASLKSRTRILSMSSGPWLHQVVQDRDVCSAMGILAIVYGTKLKTIRVKATLSSHVQRPEAEVRYKSSASFEENALISSGDISHYNFAGPIQWLYTDGSRQIHLTTGISAALLVITLPRAAYEGTETVAGKVHTKEYPLYATVGDDTDNFDRHWEPISGISAVCDETTQTCTLHLGTSGGYAATTTFTDPQDHDSLSPPKWKSQFDDIRERFDIDRDLGGLTVGRVWGMASHDGLLAAAVTTHPGDMVEYSTSSTERTTVIFSGESSHEEGRPKAFLQTIPDNSPDSLRTKRDAVLGYILHCIDYDDRNPWYQKIVYAAACCTAIESQDDKLLSQARKAFEWLATTTGVDLADEITKCSASGSTIDSKSAEQLRAPGGQIFERCDICDAGMNWYSAQEAQCANGHLFVRCGLSFLSIQEPGISKFCSGCGTEYLNEYQIGQENGVDLRRAYRKLTNVFDTCIYCNSKFRT